MEYIATANAQYSDQTKGVEPVYFYADNLTEVRHWIINHLDYSYAWELYPIVPLNGH